MVLIPDDRYESPFFHWYKNNNNDNNNNNNNPSFDVNMAF